MTPKVGQEMYNALAKFTIKEVECTADGDICAVYAERSGFDGAVTTISMTKGLYAVLSPTIRSQPQQLEDTAVI